MIAFDTNLLVRALVMDNPEQVAIARRLMERGYRVPIAHRAAGN
jgi:predicted nucleic acid-binding protein